MLVLIQNLPDHVFGVKAVGEITETELKEVLLPGLEVMVEKYGEINYLLVLETEIENWTAGAWVQDMIAGFKHFTKWEKMAIVTDQPAVEIFSNMVSFIVPGESKGFKHKDLNRAIEWLSKE